jgi:hypothetical protein
MRVLEKEKAAASARAAEAKKKAAVRAKAEKEAAAREEAAEAQRERGRQALHDSILASFRQDPSSLAKRMERCDQELQAKGPNLWVNWIPLHYCEMIDNEFQTTPEYGRLRDRVVEVCKPYRSCMDDPANRDCGAERRAYEGACEPLPDYPLCMDRTKNCIVE